MTELDVRKKFVAQAQSWLGYDEKNGLFKQIVDLYNSRKPLPRGYAVKYSDEWCATYVSAVGIACGIENIIHRECSCGKMIELYKAKGRWQENDGYIPRMGDIIIYNWKDGANYATTDCKTGASHVGIVVSVSSGSFKVIEGNKGEAVGYRTVAINGRYIRGFCLPDFASVADGKPITSAKPTTPVGEVKATGAAKSGPDKSLAGSYMVYGCSNLNMRDAGKDNAKVLTVLPAGHMVQCYGYYTDRNGTRWMYVQTTYGGVKYTGFCSSKYLKRK